MALTIYNYNNFRLRPKQLSLAAPLLLIPEAALLNPISITASWVGEIAFLQWKGLNHNNVRYEVYVSYDGSSFALAATTAFGAEFYSYFPEEVSALYFKVRAIKNGKYSPYSNMAYLEEGEEFTGYYSYTDGVTTMYKGIFGGRLAIWYSDTGEIIYTK